MATWKYDPLKYHGSDHKLFSEAANGEKDVKDLPDQFN